MQEDGTINPSENEPYISAEQLDSSLLTKEGVIIIKLFAPICATLISKGDEGFVIPSQMATITVRDDILSEYILFYLSQESVINRLLSNNTGIIQRAITINTLSNLDIEIPSYQTQQLIYDCYKNYCKKRQLRYELDQQEQKLMKCIFSVLIKENKEVGL